MTTFASWEEVGRWYHGLEKDRRAPTPDIRAKAAELTAGKTTDLEKIEALYDFVATNFRYVSLSFGVGAISRTRPPMFCTTSMATARISTRCWRRCSKPRAFTLLRC